MKQIKLLSLALAAALLQGCTQASDTPDVSSSPPPTPTALPVTSTAIGTATSCHHRESKEICNDIDDDCDGLVDEAPAGEDWYPDRDHDGYTGDPAEPVCERPVDHLSAEETLGYDCDDGDPAIHEGSPEVCGNLKDDDCDRVIDETLLWYPDVDQDGYGEASTSVTACSAPQEGWTLTGGDCDDGDSGVSPAALDTCDDGIDTNCDGLDPQCPTWETRRLGVEDLWYYTNQGAFGSSICGLDTGERYLVVGHPYHDSESRPPYPSIHLFPSAAAGPLNVDFTAATLTESDPTTSLGYEVLCSDITGDGEADVIASAPYWGGYPSGRGEVVSYVLIYHRLDSLGAQVFDDSHHTILSADSGAFGGSTDAGDLNNDGQADLVIGASYQDNSIAPLSGSVYIFFGPVLGDLDARLADVILEGTQEYEFFGWRVLASADINADGANDLLLAAPNSDNDTLYAGRVDIYLGPITAGAPPSVPFASIQAEEPCGGFGARIAVADVHPNPGLELIASRLPSLSINCSHADMLAGEVEIWSLWPVPSKLVLIRAGDCATAVGPDFSVVPDRDDDGHAELLVSARLSDVCESTIESERTALLLFESSKLRPTSTELDSVLRIMTANEEDDISFYKYLMPEGESEESFLEGLWVSGRTRDCPLEECEYEILGLELE